ncbi:MAG: putative methyltransferase YcgJ [Alphaproteobacteria bacterium MarineAlpha3_Bin7]|nr:MAG: putative methyltransferase YcgJ [Alphaproteobacteria bacterium MarineAlpha3_Bin7]
MNQIKDEIANKKKIQDFWGDLYSSLYEEVDKQITKETLESGLIELENMFRLRSHMAISEMSLEKLSGKKILEIGPGAGAHSALFAKYNAVVTSVDITFERVQSTQKKFIVLDKTIAGCQAIQGDAENLPFSDSSFDIIYSNGVLHHSTNTKTAVREAYRLLKPGGKAIIMLYCKNSWHYWVNMLFFEGICRGKLALGKNWLGHITEWGGNKKQTQTNPYTKCFTKKEIKSLFKEFKTIHLRKAEFYFYLIPVIGKLYRIWQKKYLGLHPGGELVYGEPWPIQSRLELFLGKYLGWAWFITVKK